MIWVMDSECCSRCGTLLDYFETDLCTDCLEDAWYDEEQERYAVWDGNDWEEPTIGTPEEAYAIAMSQLPVDNPSNRALYLNQPDWD